ncbi:MAG: hypothetical protein EOO65_04785 [Methanosarcinales archaeon]|nr:MAG: hypothetical protein EOO65_04785 [Methanosarcinales archaeon]
MQPCVTLALLYLVYMCGFALSMCSVASAFAAVTIVWNIILSRCFLHEEVARADVGIATLMVTGTVLAVVFGSRGTVSQGTLALDEILAVWRRTPGIVGFVLFTSVTTALMFYAGWVDRQLAMGKISRESKLFRSTLLGRTFTAGVRGCARKHGASVRVRMSTAWGACARTSRLNLPRLPWRAAV